MGRQYLRKYSLHVVNTQTQQSLTFSELRLTFKISKSVVGEPDIAEIDIYNLSDNSIAILSGQEIDLTLQTGYAGSALQTIFSGRIRNTIVARINVDKICTIYAANSQQIYDNSAFFKSYTNQATVVTILNDITNSLNGVELGSLDAITSQARNLTGATYSGSVKDILDKLSEQYGFNWSITDNVLRVYPSENAIPESSIAAVNISPQTGMIGSPTITEIGVDVSTLLNPSLTPNAIVQVQSETPNINLGNLVYRNVDRDLGNGRFKINKVTHIGDSRGNDWKSEIIARRDFVTQ